MVIRMSVRAIVVSLCCLFLFVQVDSHAQTSAPIAKPRPPLDELPPELVPVPASAAKKIELAGVVEFGYQDENGNHVMDLLEGDRAYLGLVVSTPEGRPIVGAEAKISLAGSSQLLPSERVSGDDGVIEFQVISGQMGLDQITASVRDAEVGFALNIISLKSAGFPELVEVEGGIPWSDLMQAQLEYKDRLMLASFPPSVQERAGEIVKLSGFMMPLDPDLKQQRFILTSNPPSCFFHVPGGPAGSVEVLAPGGIEVSWEPIVIEGLFEPQETSEIGVVYRLRDAHLVTQ